MTGKAKLCWAPALALHRALSRLNIDDTLPHLELASALVAQALIAAMKRRGNFPAILEKYQRVC